MGGRQCFIPQARTFPYISFKIYYTGFYQKAVYSGLRSLVEKIMMMLFSQIKNSRAAELFHSAAVHRC